MTEYFIEPGNRDEIFKALYKGLILSRTKANGDLYEIKFFDGVYSKRTCSKETKIMGDWIELDPALKSVSRFRWTYSPDYTCLPPEEERTEEEKPEVDELQDDQSPSEDDGYYTHEALFEVLFKGLILEDVEGNIFKMESGVLYCKTCSDGEWVAKEDVKLTKLYNYRLKECRYPYTWDEVLKIMPEQPSASFECDCRPDLVFNYEGDGSTSMGNLYISYKEPPGLSLCYNRFPLSVLDGYWRMVR